MRRLPLHVEQPILRPRSPEQVDQRHQGNLGRIAPDARSIEHGLACKQPADTHAVESACQQTVRSPGFNRVHDAALVAAAGRPGGSRG